MSDRNSSEDIIQDYLQSNYRVRADRKTVGLMLEYIQLDDYMVHKTELDSLIIVLTIIKYLCYNEAKNNGWYTNPETKEPIEPDPAARFALFHSEVSEAFEVWRKHGFKPKEDKKGPEGKLACELADLVIRVFDFCGHHNIPIETAIFNTLKYNRHRPDHKPENRLKEGGKKI